MGGHQESLQNLKNTFERKAVAKAFPCNSKESAWFCSEAGLQLSKQAGVPPQDEALIMLTCWRESGLEWPRRALWQHLRKGRPRCWLATLYFGLQNERFLPQKPGAALILPALIFQTFQIQLPAVPAQWGIMGTVIQHLTWVRGLKYHQLPPKRGGGNSMSEDPKRHRKQIFVSFLTALQWPSVFLGSWLECCLFLIPGAAGHHKWLPKLDLVLWEILQWLTCG